MRTRQAGPERAEIGEGAGPHAALDQSRTAAPDVRSLRDLARQAGRGLGDQALSIANHETDLILKLLGG